VSIARNLEEVRTRIAAAAERVGRAAGAVRLVAVTKTVEPARIAEAVAAGHTLFGENRAQEGLAKVPEVANATWHFIGHLQRNKARKVVESFAMIHSIDSLRLGETLDRLGQERGEPVRGLVQVNVGGEASKEGLEPDELPELLDRLAERPGLQIEGLMTVPPFVGDPDDARPYFQRLGALAREAAEVERRGVTMDELSMGMSHDFEVAIEEGATYVRLGSLIFGARPSFSE
jgi:hypothetical protein